MICRVCGIDYKVKPYELTRSKYCSRQCLYKARKATLEEARLKAVTGKPSPFNRQVSLSCRHCGKSFLVSPSRVGKRFFCSQRCYGENASWTEDRLQLKSRWDGMITRCYRATDPGFKNYGGRGITVCDEWLSSFDVFYEWALKTGFNPTLSIDRKDNNKGYSPDNCRWATMAQQASNRRGNQTVQAFGVIKTIAEWWRDSRCVVPRYETIRQRILKYGWAVEDAITTPVRQWERKSSIA